MDSTSAESPTRFLSIEDKAGINGSKDSLETEQDFKGKSTMSSNYKNGKS